MTNKEIIDGLKFTIDMFLLDPGTGEKLTEPRNDMVRITIEACRCAIQVLENYEDAVSRKAVLKTLCDVCPVYDCIYKAYSDNIGCPQFNKIRSLPSVQPYGGDVE